VTKSDPLMAAIGDVDEANSAIGVARTHFMGSDSFDAMLARIQNDLFDLGADLATPLDGDQTYALRVTPAQAEWLEQSIDRMNSALEPLRSFVLPAGEPGAAGLHLARAITRRAERSAVAAGARGDVLIYLNRLSDFLFVAARAVNQNGAGDVLWVPGASR
jgi:cob(I)alamin adenosyltransferase